MKKLQQITMECWTSDNPEAIEQYLENWAHSIIEECGKRWLIDEIGGVELEVEAMKKEII